MEGFFALQFLKVATNLLRRVQAEIVKSHLLERFCFVAQNFQRALVGTVYLQAVGGYQQDPHIRQVEER